MSPKLVQKGFIMQRSFVAATTMTLVLAFAGGAFAQSQSAAQPSQAQMAPKANLIPGGAAAAAPSFMDRLADNFRSAMGGRDSDHTASQSTTQTASSH